MFDALRMNRWPLVALIVGALIIPLAGCGDEGEGANENSRTIVKPHPAANIGFLTFERKPPSTMLTMEFGNPISSRITECKNWKSFYGSGNYSIKLLEEREQNSPDMSKLSALPNRAGSKSRLNRLISSAELEAFGEALCDKQPQCHFEGCVTISDKVIRFDDTDTRLNVTVHGMAAKIE